MGRPPTRCGGCRGCHSKKACEVLRRQREGLEGGSPASPSECLQEEPAPEAVLITEEDVERAEVSRQLAELLGKSEEELQRIRQTPEGKASLIDTVATMSGLDANQAGLALRSIQQRYPEVQYKILNYKFPGRGQRDTPVADLATVYEILMVLPGRNAARIRSQAARLMVRYLGGDLTLIQDVERLHHVQQRMAEEDPANPHRVFGAAVEAEAAAQENTAEVEENPKLPELEVIELDVSFARVADKHLYAMTTEANYIQNLWKIGVASDVGQRERELQTGSSGGIRAFLVWPRMEQLESIVLRALPSPGASGGSEWRHCTVSDLKAKVNEALVELKRRLSLPPPVVVRTRPRQDDDDEQRRSVRRRREELELGEQEQVLAEKVQALLSVQTRQMLMTDLARQGNIEGIRILLRREELELGEQEQFLAEKIQASLSSKMRQMLLHDLTRQGNMEAIRIFLRREDDAGTA